MTAATTSNAPATCRGAIDWSSKAQAKTSAQTGSMFMMAELPTTPKRGNTVNMMVKAVP